MKILVIYYSRTGTTKKVAEAMARLLPADIEEINDLKNRDGIWGWLGAGRDAMRRKETSISPVSANAADYEHVIIGTPVWAGTMAAGVRTYLAANAEKIKRYSVFTTQGSLARQRVFDDIRALIGRNSYAELYLAAKNIKNNDFDSHLKDFIIEIKRSLEI